jgi:hypothetical protein
MRAIVLVVTVGLMACGEKRIVKQKAEAPKLPLIKHFYGNETVVPQGGSVTLCYGTENVDKLTLRPSADSDLRPSFNRCVAENVEKDTTFVLTASGPGGETTASFTVRVGKAPPRVSTLIQNFTIVGNTPVAAGGRVQLCYSTDGGVRVSVRPKVDAKLEGGRNQCFVVTPQETTNYVLTATGADGSVDRMQVTVPVQ